MGSGYSKNNMVRSSGLLVATATFGLTSTSAVCPYLYAGTPLENEDITIPDEEVYNSALSTLDIEAVFNDIYEILLDSQDCWPADTFNGEESYAGLFLRLAWHCSGTFRETDGKGGCAGGRQRYQPESAWIDNVNLDKARALLGPVKETYGDALSWGDLFVFAGDAAILQGGGPVTEVCAGRIDNTDGTLSDALDDDTTCDPQGDCQPPLGSSTSGLIYVDATGYLGNPDPVVTAPHIREIFSRMGMSDSETVALIGGGHAFGKAHGPCVEGAGPGPDEAPENPWPGLCGSNFPDDAYTSGIEGVWTKYPFLWDNEFFTQLRDDEYNLITGPGGKYQWYNTRNNQMMLTTDLALRADDSFLEIVTEFANDISTLDTAFSNAWEKLTTSGGTWASNKFCVSGTSLGYDELNLKCPKISEEIDEMVENGMTGCENDVHCQVCPNPNNAGNSVNKGCAQCDNGYFKKDWGYECSSCNVVFNAKCDKCTDFIGCVQCKDGYKKEYDESCGLTKCVIDDGNNGY